MVEVTDNIIKYEKKMYNDKEGKKEWSLLPDKIIAHVENSK